MSPLSSRFVFISSLAKLTLSIILLLSALASSLWKRDELCPSVVEIYDVSGWVDIIVDVASVACL